MAFLKDLRRRSKSSFRKEKPSSRPDPEANGNGMGNTNGNGSILRNIRNKSSSTLNSTPGTFGSTTPPSTLPSEESTGLNCGQRTPPIPVRPPINNKRYSLNGSGMGSFGTNGSQRSLNTSSLLAPRVHSITSNTWTHQKVLLISGTIGDPSLKPLDGTLTCCHHQDSFPATNWPVHDSHFKVLVHLQPGPNKLRLDFTSPKVSSSATSIPAHSSFIQINYLPLSSAPPLHLAIILGKDSPGTYDAVPERLQREGNGLDLATKKFRMAAYLWQAFTGEQMYRNGLGRRCFRFEEQWQPGTLTYEDQNTGTMRNEAKIHIIRSSKTVAEIRDLDLAQQYDKATKKGDLFGIAAEALKGHFPIKDGQKHYVSCLFLDAHWDPKVKTVRGHAALGGGDGTLQLAIFGSHALQSYPASLEEVVPAFSDCTRTDTAYVANDCNESGSNWEAANIGIGAHLHETGHLFGCPHQESGVMLRDYVRLNRTFTCREPYSTRTRSPGPRLVLEKDECTWHRLDCLRFRFHPCFRLPSDVTPSTDGSVQVWTVDNGGVLATAATGIAWVELYTEGDDLCHNYIEYFDPTGSKPPPNHVSLIENDLRDRLPKDRRNRKLQLEIFSAGQGKHVIQDFSQLANAKNCRVRLPDGRWGFRGSKLGFSQMDGSKPEELIIESSYIQTKLLKTIRVWHGFAVDGIELIYEDSESQMFGKRGGKPSDFSLDTRRGELLMGFYLRAGLWIDGIQILTSMGRKSEIFGNRTGGSGHTLIPPRGYTVAGISGSCAAYLDGFSLIIKR